MAVFIVTCGCGLVFFARFFLALCADPQCKRSTKVWFIRARMHRIMAEKRFEQRDIAVHKRAA